MGDYALGDIVFIVFILGVIHGIMLLIGIVRRRKAARNTKASPE